MVNSISITGNSNYNVTRAYEAHRDLLTSITNNWGSGGAGTVTQFSYVYNPLRQRVSSAQSGSAFADYYSGTSYGSVFNFQTFDTYGQLIDRAMYRNSPPTYPNQPSSGDLLPARTYQFDYDTVGNRQDSGEIGNAYDSYSVNNLNQYSSRGNHTVRVFGNTNLTATVGISGGTSVGQLERNFGGDFIPSNGSGPAQGTITVTATMPNSTPSTVNRNYVVPPQVQSFSYDADGNLTADALWTYAYDAENRLISMTSQLPSGFANSYLQLTFTYDYANRRVEKNVYNTSTQQTVLDRRYIYDGNNLVAETDTGGKILRSYSWGLDLAGSLDATGGVGALLEITNYAYNGSTLTGTTNYFPQFDGNGNVAALVRGDGVTAAVYEFGPFGEYLRSEVFDSAIADNPFKFSTKFSDTETGLINYGNRYYNPSLGRFINRDPIEEAGGINLYGFCGNDGIDRFDVLGNSWLSKLWDRTILSLGKKIAINWDHGRQYVEMAAAIVVSCFVGFEVAAAVESALEGTTVAVLADGTMVVTAASSGTLAASLAAVAPIVGGAVGGAAGGFVSGVSSSAMSGQNLGQALQSGLKGAEFGMLQGGIAAGIDMLNSGLTDAGYSTKPTAPATWKALGSDVRILGIKGAEGAITNKLLAKNASAGFWSGVDSGLAGIPMPSSWSIYVKDLEKGIMGGLTGMNRHGKGFMTGLWNAEAKVATQTAESWFDSNVPNPWARYPLRTLTSAAVQASVGRFEGKGFSAGLFAGGEGRALNDLLGGMEHNPEKANAASSPVNSAFKLLTPKISKRGLSLPLDSISGGYWAKGVNWAQLFSLQLPWASQNP